jgi:hypothetical protein
MSTFLALYRGDTVGKAQLVAVSADPTTVADFASRLLGEPAPPRAPEGDPVLASIEQGRRKALRLIARERPAPTALVEPRP